MALTRGWQTDLAVLRHTGSTIDDRGDHLVVRSPHSPTFHWGNFVLVTDPDAADDGPRWVKVFHAQFPDAEHVSIGLPGMPSEGSWAHTGLVVQTDEVLFTERLPQQLPLAAGYTARAFTTEADWAASVAIDLAENARTATHSAAGYEGFVRNQLAARRVVIDKGLAQWVGAWAPDGTLAASLGIVLCDDLARFQSVGTDAAHRRRGLAGHLLGLAARWAGERGATAWVIVTESTNPAGRVYRSVGFEPDAVQVAASQP